MKNPRLYGQPPYRVALTHTLRKYCDRSPRYRFPGPYAESYELAMARNEFEGVQVLVYPMAGVLEGVIDHAQSRKRIATYRYDLESHGPRDAAHRFADDVLFNLTADIVQTMIDPRLR